MEIIDSQVHANRMFPDNAGIDLGGSVEATVVAMDAVGVDAIVVDEWLGWDENNNHLPGYRAPNGAWRTLQPYSEEAVRRYPKRFGFLCRVDNKDPDLDTAMSEVRNAPGRFGIRLTKRGTSEVARIEQGEYATLLALAEKHDIPVFANLGTKPEVIIPYMEKHPGLRFTLDHTGVQLPENDNYFADRFTRFDRIVAMARLPNLYVKWCHIERISLEGYPFKDILEPLRRIMDAFGPQRIMWAGDWTQSRKPDRSAHPCNWAQTLHYVLDSDKFTTEEKEWFFGKSARAFLRWT